MTHESLDSYARQSQMLIAGGMRPESPSTTTQLEWLADNHPDMVIPFLPPMNQMCHLGLPTNLARTCSFDECWREQFLHTMLGDRTFIEAVFHVLQSTQR